MPIFPRRVIQKILNENRLFMPDDQVNEHVKKLNAQDSTSIAAEWEIVILNVLSKIGKVQHEKKFSGSRKPDIYFESSDIVPFVADITAISDEFYNKENPINYFYECLNNFFRKEGLTTKGLRVEVGSKNLGNYGDRKVKLALPEKKDIPSFIKVEFRPIIEVIKKAPTQAFKTEIKQGNASVSIVFAPKAKHFTGGYASYTVPYSLRKNPIFHRLRNKAGQLRGSEYQGVMGVFVCDGECDLLNNDFYCVEKYPQQDIIQEVFRNNTSLSFVIVLTPEEKHHTLGVKTTRFINGIFYFNPHAKYPVDQTFFKELSQFKKYFPVPQSMPVNAKNYMKSKKDEGYSHYGGFAMSQGEIKISSRMITELLAGALDFKKFDEDHKAMNIDKKNYIKEFFIRQLQQGKMIENISIEKCPDEDDDWVKFEYGESDPAISKFK
jgi:hypothetical protein